jgi:hypothetical protein
MRVSMSDVLGSGGIGESERGQALSDGRSSAESRTTEPECSVAVRIASIGALKQQAVADLSVRQCDGNKNSPDRRAAREEPLRRGQGRGRTFWNCFIANTTGPVTHLQHMPPVLHETDLTA